MRFPKFQRLRGFTLLELMVAMTLGSLVTLSVLTLYIGASRSYAQEELYALLQQNGRYALKVLGKDLAMADFWGQVMSTDTISASFTVVGTDCAVGVDAYNASNALLFNNYHESPTQTHFVPCALVQDNLLPNTDVIFIKRVEGAPTAETVDGTVYLRTNGTDGSLLNNAPAIAQTVGQSDWRYIPRIYFVRDYLDTSGDGIPALCRIGLDDTSLSDIQCLAEGVEDLHLQFGIDSDIDGVANRYSATPSASEMDDVVAVRIYVLVRSNAPNPHYTNAKT
ncbi:MAG: type IV pilus assembly protein PilW, partial [Gammaproteobacteria bacterium]